MSLRKSIGLTCLLPLAVTLACGAPVESEDSFGSAEEGVAGEEVASEENAASEDVAASDDTQAFEEEGPSDIVASADVGYGTVYFHERKNDDGSFAIGISEVAPGNYATTPLSHLLASGQTTLEAFVAVLPDAEPPASFVDSHPAQAKLLGRATDELQPGVFDANMPIEKSITWCKNWATPASIGDFDYTYSSQLFLDDTFGSQQLTLDAGKKATAPAICNQTAANKSSGHTVQGRVRMKKNGGSYDSPGWSPAVAVGDVWHWHGLQLMEWPTSCPPGLICLPFAVNATYNIQGKSRTTSTNNTYDLYIAKIETVTFTGIIK